MSQIDIPPQKQTIMDIKSVPLIVDIDGTLLATDTLYEAFVFNFFKRPFSTLWVCRTIFTGRATLKSNLAKLGHPDYASLPRHLGLVSYLTSQHETGRAVHIVTAADQSVADAILAESPFADSARGSNNGVNLKAEKKAQYLTETYPNGFVYCGDSSADLAVWRHATGAIPVATSAKVERKLDALDIPIEAKFDHQGDASLFKSWRRALRLHQWSKNILLFVPLFLAHVYNQPALVMATIAGFLLMGIIASGTYILNDLSDLSSDRHHKTKRNRPFASGRLSLKSGALTALLLIGTGLVLAFWFNRTFGLILLVYLGTTLSYSFRLKRVVLLDVFILGMLYSIRLILGVSLIAVPMSQWLIAFSFLFFYSMSLAKRNVELRRADGPPDAPISGRGYRPEDWPLTLSLGVASAFGSIIVIVLYLTEEAFPSDTYSSPEWLWSVPLLIALWIQRIWLLSQRGELNDDPVAFAVKDPISIGLGICLGLFFIAATIL